MYAADTQMDQLWRNSRLLHPRVFDIEQKKQPNARF
jgi:hypothetical protein